MTPARSRTSAVLAAAVVEGALGVLAGTLLNLLDAGHEAMAVFALLAVAGAAADIVLVPGWVWAGGGFASRVLLRRTGVATLALVLAAIAGIGLTFGLMVLSNPFDRTPVWIGLCLFALVIAAAGALVGLGAGEARDADARSPEDGPPRAGSRAYLLGGALGVLPILALAFAAAVAGQTPERIVPRSWPLLPALACLALILAALPHNALVLRASPVRPAPARAFRRAAALAVPVLALAAGAALLTPPDLRPLGHRSPDGRLAVLAWSDTAFGQVEMLRVMADPGTSAARRIFDHFGDVPHRFLRWRDEGTAELEVVPRDGRGVRRLLLTCAADACRLEDGPEP